MTTASSQNMMISSTLILKCPQSTSLKCPQSTSTLKIFLFLITCQMEVMCIHVRTYTHAQYVWQSHVENEHYSVFNSISSHAAILEVLPSKLKKVSEMRQE